MLRNSALALVFSLSVASSPWAAQIASFSPQGRVSVVESVRATFDMAVVDFGDDQAAAPLDVVCDDMAVKGQGRWTDDRHWSYVFTVNPGPGTTCSAIVRPAFRTAAGEALRGKSRFSFQTGGPHIVDTRPYGSTIDEDQVFVLRFNGSVKPDTVLAHTTCLIDGLGEAVPVRAITGAERDALLEASYFPKEQQGLMTQLVQCKRRLPAEARVRLKVGAGVAAQSGVVSTAAQHFDYSVRAPFKATFSCQRENANAPCTPVLPITVAFNAPVSVEQAAKVRLQLSSGERAPTVDGDRGYRNSVNSVRFDGPFPERAELTVSLPFDLVDDAGRALSNADQFPLTTRTAPYPPLVKFAAAPFGVIERLANVPAGQSEADYPASVPLTLRNVEAALRGKELGVSTGKVRDYATQSDKDVLHWYARVQRLESGRWTPAQIKAIMADKAPSSDDAATIDTREFSVLNTQKNTQELTLPAISEEDPRPFEVIGVPVGEPGFHVLEVESARLGQSLLASAKPMYVRTTALVTNLGVHIKRGRDDMLAWVTTLDTGRVVPDAQVAVLSCSGEVLATGKTDAQGLWHHVEPIDAPDYCESTGLSGVYVSARIPANHPQAHGKADFSFVMSDWNGGIEPWRFNVPTDSDPVPTTITHTVFDRTLFRAGETVSMKHFIRTQVRDGLALPVDPSALPDKLVIEHQGSDQRYEQPLTWTKTPSGGLNAQSRFAIPETAKLGVYSIALMAKDDYAATDGQFRVEEFKLPVLTGNLKISGDSGAAVLVAPRTLSADMQISYVSGGPAGELPVSISGVMRDKWVTFDGYEDYSFSPPSDARQDDSESSSNEESEGSQKLFLDKKSIVLDAQGGARLTLDALPAIERPQELLFEAGFADPNGEIQTIQQVVSAWPADWQAGIRTGSWVQMGQPVPVSALALSSAGQPQANADVTVSAVSQTTYSTRKRMVGGFYSYDNHTETRDLGTVCQGKTDDKGVLACSVELNESGSIQLIATVSDAQGRKSKAVSTVWVVGASELWFGGQNDDRIDVIPEKKNYRPGETARFQVRMPFREATALVSVEREGVLATQVVALEGTDPSVEVLMQPQWGPNVYVSVLVLRGRLRAAPWYSFFTWGWQQPKAWYGAFKNDKSYAAPTALVDLSKPAFRFGLAQVNVSDTQDQLTVKVTADKPTYPVRGKAKVAIQVTKPDGQPAANGQVAFAAVDQALLELSPNTSWDLLDAMRQRRSYGVETATAQMQIVGRRHYGRKALPAGGGGGKSPTRELLDTLLLWQPLVQLDEQGRAELTLPLNDAITRFRLVAVADYGATQFGTGNVQIATTQDVQVISGLPALVREGDRYQAMATVRNTTQRDMRIRVDAGFEAQGVSDQRLEPQSVAVAAGAAQTVVWTVTAPQSNAFEPSTQLKWKLQASEEYAAQGNAGQTGQGESPAFDRLAVNQTLIPVVPVAATQATLLALDSAAPIRLAVSPPKGAELNANGVPRGGLEVNIQSSLAGGLPGVKRWFEAYPYTCLEQLSSKAIGLRSSEQWQAVMRRLPSYLDADGLAAYFPGARQGSEVLTAYLLSASHEAQSLGLPFAIPDDAKDAMRRGLLAFVEGRIVRNRWAPQADQDVRKLLAIEALSREGLANPRMLSSIAIEPDRWPTSAVIDWLAILQRVPEVANRQVALKQAKAIIDARLLRRGADLVFADDVQNNWWWLMLGPEVTAAKLMLTVMGQPDWAEDMPGLAQGLIGRQSHGAWRTTTANLMGSLALEKFALQYERAPLAGTSRVQLGTQASGRELHWEAAPKAQVGAAGLSGQQASGAQHLFEPWPDTESEALTITHHGTGQGWATIRALAAVPPTKPVMAGYEVSRQVSPVSQATPGVWSRGDVYRVKIAINAKTASTWAVLSDPVPAGATLLGSGLGRDSSIATETENHREGVSPSFVERSFEAYRAYYEYLPQGVTHIEYTVRLNSVGQFHLPATRVEALYQPEVYGLLPHPDGLLVQDAK